MAPHISALALASITSSETKTDTETLKVRLGGLLEMIVIDNLEHLPQALLSMQDSEQAVVEKLVVFHGLGSDEVEAAVEAALPGSVWKIMYEFEGILQVVLASDPHEGAVGKLLRGLENAGEREGWLAKGGTFKPGPRVWTPDFASYRVPDLLFRPRLGQRKNNATLLVEVMFSQTELDATRKSALYFEDERVRHIVFFNIIDRTTSFQIFVGQKQRKSDGGIEDLGPAFQFHHDSSLQLPTTSLQIPRTALYSLFDLESALDGMNVEWARSARMLWKNSNIFEIAAADMQVLVDNLALDISMWRSEVNARQGAPAGRKR